MKKPIALLALIAGCSSSTAPRTGSLTATVRAIATAIAFDDSGDLWFADFLDGTIVELKPAQLMASGAMTPAVDVAYGPSPLFYPTAFAFNPHTVGLPLH